jgi:hypothetical protein
MPTACTAPLARIGCLQEHAVQIAKDGLQVEWLYANDAVHRTKPISPAVSVLVADELFQVFRWLALTYGRDATSIRGFSFDKALLPQPQSSPREPAMSLEQLQELANQLAERDSSPAPCQCGHQPTRSGSHRT